MWKFKDLYEKIIKQIRNDNNAFNTKIKNFSTYVDKYGDIDIPRPSRPSDMRIGSSCSASTYSESSSDANKDFYGYPEPPPQIKHYAICTKCDPNNALFYDTRVYDECPRCKELREQQPEFLSESDVML